MSKVSPDKLLAHAATFIGVHEEPPGSNRGKQIDKWEQRAQKIKGEPWCACFGWCMYADVGVKVPVQFPASAGSWVDWATQNNRLRKRPFRGMAVSYSWEGTTPRPADHFGIVEKVLALPRLPGRTRYWIRTIEGNTGDAVRRRWRWVDPSAVAFMDVLGTTK